MIDSRRRLISSGVTHGMGVLSLNFFSILSVTRCFIISNAAGIYFVRDCSICSSDAMPRYQSSRYIGTLSEVTLSIVDSPPTWVLSRIILVRTILAFFKTISHSFIGSFSLSFHAICSMISPILFTPSPSTVLAVVRIFLKYQRDFSEP